MRKFMNHIKKVSWIVVIISLLILIFTLKNKDGESLFLSFDFLGNIFGALVGGLLAFWIAYIQIKDQRKQQDEQHKLEIKKIGIEFKLKNMDLQTSLLSELLEKIGKLKSTIYLEKSLAEKILEMDKGVALSILYEDILKIINRLNAIIDPKYDQEIKKMIDKFNNYYSSDLKVEENFNNFIYLALEQSDNIYTVLESTQTRVTKLLNDEL